MPAFLSRWIFTTEFWMTGAANYMLYQMAQLPEVNAGWPMAAMGITTGAYTVGRSLAKNKS